MFLVTITIAFLLLFVQIFCMIQLFRTGETILGGFGIWGCIPVIFFANFTSIFGG